MDMRRSLWATASLPAGRYSENVLSTRLQVLGWTQSSARAPLLPPLPRAAALREAEGGPATRCTVH